MRAGAPVDAGDAMIPMLQLHSWVGGRVEIWRQGVSRAQFPLDLQHHARIGSGLAMACLQPHHFGFVWVGRRISPTFNNSISLAVASGSARASR